MNTLEKVGQKNAFVDPTVKQNEAKKEFHIGTKPEKQGKKVFTVAH